MMKTGIDVSEWQGVIDWDKVKGKIDFAILRAGYGRAVSQVDKKFEANYKACKEKGIPCGVYWYSYATTPEEAEKEAETLLSVIKGKQFEYPIYFDVEESKVLAMGKAKVTAIVNAALNKIEKAGYWVGLYMSASPLSTLVEDATKKRFAVWVAHYGVEKPSYSGDYGVWQYSSKGKIEGINGDVDMNKGYVDYPSLIKVKGLNGYNKAVEQTKEITENKSVKVAVTIGNEVYGGTLYEMKGE